MTKYTGRLTEQLRQAAVTLALIVPLSGNAAMVPLVDTQSTITFDMLAPETRNLRPFGEGVSGGAGLLMAPVQAFVEDAGPGPLQVLWGADAGFDLFAPNPDLDYGRLRASNFTLSLADNLIRVDLDLEREGQTPLAFDQLALFRVVGVEGQIGGRALTDALVQPGVSQALQLSADVFINEDGMLAYIMGVNPGYDPQSHPLPQLPPIGRIEILSAVPEPATWASMALGLAGIMAIAARRRRQAASLS